MSLALIIMSLRFLCAYMMVCVMHKTWLNNYAWLVHGLYQPGETVPRLWDLPKAPAYCQLLHHSKKRDKQYNIRNFDKFKCISVIFGKQCLRSTAKVIVESLSASPI